jgi:alpha/beta superfamily hydrolase
MAGGGKPILRRRLASGLAFFGAPARPEVPPPVPRSTAPARVVSEDELFLDDGVPIYVTHHRTAGTSFAVLAPPLFEEQARTRKLLVNLARDLAAAGIDAVRFDYPGTGLSEGTTEQLTLTAAFDALRRAVAYCHRHGATQVHLFGFRLGGYLTLSALPRLPASRAVVWEPILDVASYFQELLRIEMSNQMVTFGKVKQNRDELLALLRAGQSVIVDGNRIGPTLHRELEAAPAIELGALAPFKDRLTVLVWDSKKVHEMVTRAGLVSLVVPDVKFSWKHIRFLEPRSPALFRETLHAVKG